MSRRDSPVNAPKDMARRIKFIAESKGMSIADYLEAYFSDTVNKHFQDAVEKLHKEVEELQSRSVD